MIPTYRAVGMLALTALGACAQEERHPIDRYLSQLRPVTVAPLAGVDWPAGTLVCPLTPYQSALPTSAPAAGRVNAFLQRKQFVGDEFHWSLVAVKPGNSGDADIEHLAFKNSTYEVATGMQRLKDASAAVPPTFTVQDCVPVEHARVLATRSETSHQTFIVFGKEIK